jgi:hypothetical protein
MIGAIVPSGDLAMTEPSRDSGSAFNWTNIELGPSLPMAVFTSTERWQPERIGALALYCSDGRWGEAFDQFCHHHLHIPRYDRWALPGGPAWLLPHSDNLDFHPTVREQLDFLVKIHEVDRIVLITHFGCAYYAQRLQRPPQDCLAAQTKDAQEAAATLRHWYPNVNVETYLAMRHLNWLSFHEIRMSDVGFPPSATV